MKLGTYITQGVLVTKRELWIPPSSSYVTNVTVRLRWKRLYGSSAVRHVGGGGWVTADTAARLGHSRKHNPLWAPPHIHMQMPTAAAL